MKMYHMSSAKNRESILEHGIDYRLGKTSDNTPVEGNYLFPVALLAMIRAWDYCDVWEVCVTDLELTQDPAKYYECCSYTAEAIGPDRITLYYEKDGANPMEHLSEDESKKLADEARALQPMAFC